MVFSKTTDMPFFQPLGGQSGRGHGTKRGAPASWSFKTEDVHAVVDTDAYFNEIIGLLSVGDLIWVAVVTNRGAANEALVTYGHHAVIANDGVDVNVTDVTIGVMTDAD